MAKSIALKVRVDDRASDLEAQDQDAEIVPPAAPRRGRAGAVKA